MANKLKHEKSPYLLQHVNNPVDWYPWSPEAFKLAKDQNKPIFLSIGYAACHWCHVMEHESFEDPEVAKILNLYFVSIKVDREERPDIDQLYMTVTQRFTGQGGWPMTIFMTPNQEPFAAGTYFPKLSRHGRIGLLELLERIQNLWSNRWDDLKREATKLTDKLTTELAELSGTKSEHQELGTITQHLNLWTEQALDELELQFDSTYGGFGSAPKFPTGHNLLFLLQAYKTKQNTEYLAMVEVTLQAMRRGGIWDHLGYGFHRYSTDAHWLVPHFEKMLYDQAMLLMAYTEAFSLTLNPLYQETADQIIQYLIENMTHPEGGFYSAEDADSEGVEGRFYTWSHEEILSILGYQEAKKFCAQFNVNTNGNFFDEATGTNTGVNILHGSDHMPEQWRAQLISHRIKRIPPLKDDKILTDWNGLMIAALARAGQVFNKPLYVDMATKALGFLVTHLIQPNGTFLKRWREGEAKYPGCLEDYAFVLWGLVELYEATRQAKYLVQAQQLAEIIIKDFEDSEAGGYFTSSIYGEKLIIRPKEAYDGALPSGNSVVANCFAKLGLLLGRIDLIDKAKLTLLSFRSVIQHQPQTFTHGLQVLPWLEPSAHEIVLVGDPESELFNEFYARLKNRPLGSVLHVICKRNKHNQIDHLDNDPDTDNLKLLESLIPALGSMNPPSNAKAAVFICSNFVCQSPITRPELLPQITSGIDSP
jgi:uncharacterized protein YyaL (SSP411 family)